jgi:hypothetical protein
MVFNDNVPLLSYQDDTCRRDSSKIDGMPIEWFHVGIASAFILVSGM